MPVFTAGLIRVTLPVNVRSRIGVDVQLDGPAVGDPRRHLLGNLRDHLQRIEAHDGHDRHLRLDQLAKVDQPLLDVPVEWRADVGVPELAVREVHGRLRRLDAGPEVPGVLTRRLVLGFPRLQGRPCVVERLLRDEGPLEELAGPVEVLRRLVEVGCCALDVRRLLDLRQMVRIGRAVLRQRPGVGRLLLLERVLLFFVVEADEDLPGLDPVAEVREHLLDPSVGLGGNRDLIHGRQGSYDVDRAPDGILVDR